MNKIAILLTFLFLTNLSAMDNIHSSGQDSTFARVQNNQNTKALWVNLGIGGMGGSIEEMNYGGIKFESSLHFRYKNFVSAAGYESGGWVVRETYVHWLTMGVALYNPIACISVNAGPTISQYSQKYWEQNRAYSNEKFGGVLKAEAYLNLYEGYVGFGINYTLHSSDQLDYRSVTIFLAMGNFSF